MRNDMTDPKLTHFTIFEAFSGSNEKGRVSNSTFFKGLSKAGERIRTADVQLGNSSFRLQSLASKGLMAALAAKNEGFKWLAGH